MGPQVYDKKQRSKTAQGAEFSQAAIAKAVLKTTVQKPYVLYPTVLGVLGLTASVLLGPKLFFLLLATLGIGAGLGIWSFDYFGRKQRHANDYLQHLHKILADRRIQVIEPLKTDLRAVGSEPGLEQLARLNEKFRAFEDMLLKKLDPHELTYGRYLGMAEQVYLSSLDNLQRIANILQSIRAIEDDYLDRRIDGLERLAKPGQAQLDELETLKQRRALKQEQLEKVQYFFTENEEAMTQMDLTRTAIASMTTTQGHASTDMETAMKELQALTQRARDYSLQD